MALVPFPLGVAVLVLVTVIWGTTFVVVKETLEVLPVPLLLALRFSAALLLFVWVPLRRKALKPAMLLGLIAFGAFAAQTIGLSITTASKAAFITGLSVILTPMVSAVWFRNRIPPRAWASAGVALVGLALMTLWGERVGGLNAGDLWVLVTALGYALYVVYLGEAVERAPALPMAAWQHLPMALLAWAWAWPHAGMLPEVPLTAYAAVGYLAVVATAGVAVLQTYAQKVVPAYLAALIFVLEPVFAAVFAYWLLGERLGPVGWVGAALVLVAMTLAELRPKQELRGARQDPTVTSGS